MMVTELDGALTKMDGAILGVNPNRAYHYHQSPNKSNIITIAPQRARKKTYRIYIRNKTVNKRRKTMSTTKIISIPLSIILMGLQIILHSSILTNLSCDAFALVPRPHVSNQSAFRNQRESFFDRSHLLSQCKHRLKREGLHMNGLGIEGSSPLRITSTSHIFTNRLRKRRNNSIGRNPFTSSPLSSSSSKSTWSQLCAMRKRQTAVFDGAEFASIASVLKYEYDKANSDVIDVTDESGYGYGYDLLAEEGDLGGPVPVPLKKAGYMTFATGTLLDVNAASKISTVLASRAISGSDRVIGIEIDSDSFYVSEDNEESKEISAAAIQIDDNVYLDPDSVAIIPNGISDVDAISTAVAALSGVRCSLPSEYFKSKNEDLDGEEESAEPKEGEDDSIGGKEIKFKAVILGGGDYACFIAKALDMCGLEVSLVTTRPMSLKETALNPLFESNVNAMAPAVGEDEVGFSKAIGNFDVVIDTLQDEANLQGIDDFEEGIEKVFGETGVASKLRRDNNCERYISTLTQSQKIVLQEGILFARGPVLKYQKDTEKAKLTSEENGSINYMDLPPPFEYGQILQKLFEGNIIFPSDRNENGAHKNKKTFVRGCSFPDYAEIEIWPADSTDGAVARYGFPGIGELTLEAKMEKMMGKTKKKAGGSKNREQSNPFVRSVESLADVREDIVKPKRDAVLFVSAPYCKLCRSMKPAYTRMARISKEEKNSDLLFAEVSRSGKEGKQLTFTLNIESVPTFVLFKNGAKYGEPFGAVKLPSKKLDAAIENMMSGQDWDPNIIGMETKVRRTKLK